jgi:stearoyl-CoA desaturase (delta-9 desaturase)
MSTKLRIPGGREINWPATIVLLVFHVGAVAALFVFTWAGFAIALFLTWLAGGLGISMGYHRLHTHRSYRVPLILEYFFALCGTLALEGGPIFWVATHRIHHQKSDQPGDPHSPRDGVWWAHAGWILFGAPDQSNTVTMSKYAPDLVKHRFYVWLNDYHWVPTLVAGAVFFAIGGLSLVLWGICLRVVVGLHGTWLVNSGAHMWGTRRFATRDDSRNNWWIALISFGEGWHNNHHAHPTSARHGLAWYEFDASWMQIRLMERWGIAKSVRVAQVDTKADSSLDVDERGSVQDANRSLFSDVV